MNAPVTQAGPARAEVIEVLAGGETLRPSHVISSLPLRTTVGISEPRGAAGGARRRAGTALPRVPDRAAGDRRRGSVPRQLDLHPSARRTRAAHPELQVLEPVDGPEGATPRSAWSTSASRATSSGTWTTTTSSRWPATRSRSSTSRRRTRSSSASSRACTRPTRSTTSYTPSVWRRSAVAGDDRTSLRSGVTACTVTTTPTTRCSPRCARRQHPVGTNHDIWAVNAESVYHEEHVENEDPYRNRRPRRRWSSRSRPSTEPVKALSGDSSGQGTAQLRDGDGGAAGGRAGASSGGQGGERARGRQHRRPGGGRAAGASSGGARRSRWRWLDSDLRPPRRRLAHRRRRARPPSRPPRKRPRPRQLDPARSTCRARRAGASPGAPAVLRGGHHHVRDRHDDQRLQHVQQRDQRHGRDPDRARALVVSVGVSLFIWRDAGARRSRGVPAPTLHYLATRAAAPRRRASPASSALPSASAASAAARARPSRKRSEAALWVLTRAAREDHSPHPPRLPTSSCPSPRTARGSGDLGLAPDIHAQAPTLPEPAWIGSLTEVLTALASSARGGLMGSAERRSRYASASVAGSGRAPCRAVWSTLLTDLIPLPARPAISL